jgi:large subunit ribosomal protein L23
MSKTLTLKPRLSEKTYKLSETRVYVVDVPETANKYTVAAAIEAQFEVKVDNVRTANIKGKRKRTVSLLGKRYQSSTGKRSNIKKAYVTLKEVNSLPFFAAVEEEEQKEKATQEQIEKAMDKQAQKDAKPARRGIRRRKDDSEETQ